MEDSIRRDRENTDYVSSWIEGYIKYATGELSNGVLEPIIVEKLQEIATLDDKNIFYIMMAARMLYKDRTTAPQKKIPFKRV